MCLKNTNSQLTDMRRGGVRVQAGLPANLVSITPPQKKHIVLGLLGGGASCLFKSMCRLRP